MSPLSFELIRLDDGQELIAVSERGGIQTLVDPAQPTKAAAPYLKAFDKATPQNAKHALMIGAGAFAGPVHYIAEHPKVKLVAVEINEAYIEAAEKLGFSPFELSRLTPVIADGMRYLETCVWMRKKQRATKVASSLAPYLTSCKEFGPFDMIMVDAFTGLKQDQMFSTPYGLALLKENLRPGGRVAFNISVSFTNPKPLFALRRNLKEVFRYVEVLQATFLEVASKDNFVVVSSDKALKLEDALEI